MGNDVDFLKIVKIFLRYTALTERLKKKTVKRENHNQYGFQAISTLFLP